MRAAVEDLLETGEFWGAFAPLRPLHPGEG